MSAQPRRTQQERREATIGKLIDATIECLIENGYRDTSIARICQRAGVSHGGLFRHFSSRNELVAAATDAIVQRHLTDFSAVAIDPAAGDDFIEPLVSYFRTAARSPITAAWREVLVAARTNQELNDAIRPAVVHFEQGVMELAAKLSGKDIIDRAFGTLVLSLLHMFDSEATTAAVLPTPDVLQMRHEWAVSLLRDALASS